MSEISRDWKLNQCGRREWEISTAVDGKQQGFCDIYNNEDDEVFSDDQLEAFATLMTAAPKFLAEAKTLIDRHDENARTCNFHKCGCDECTPFRRIIEKIEGNPS